MIKLVLTVIQRPWLNLASVWGSVFWLVDCSDFKNIYKDIKGISFFHLNISSLLKHIDGLSALIEQLIPFEIIAITETRISKESIPHNIELPNYT